jgi:hypothetical protein
MGREIEKLTALGVESNASAGTAMELVRIRALRKTALVFRAQSSDIGVSARQTLDLALKRRRCCCALDLLVHSLSWRQLG